MDQWFEVLSTAAHDKRLSPRLRFTVRHVLDLKMHQWNERLAQREAAPTLLSQVHEPTSAEDWTPPKLDIQDAEKENNDDFPVIKEAPTIGDVVNNISSVEDFLDGKKKKKKRSARRAAADAFVPPKPSSSKDAAEAPVQQEQSSSGRDEELGCEIYLTVLSFQRECINESVELAKGLADPQAFAIGAMLRGMSMPSASRDSIGAMLAACVPSVMPTAKLSAAFVTTRRAIGEMHQVDAPAIHLDRFKSLAGYAAQAVEKKAITVKEVHAAICTESSEEDMTHMLATELKKRIGDEAPAESLHKAGLKVGTPLSVLSSTDTDYQTDSRSASDTE